MSSVDILPQLAASCSSCEPQATGCCERCRSGGQATTRRSAANLAVFWRCFAFGMSVRLAAVQVAPSPRIRPREVQRHDGSEGDEEKTRPHGVHPTAWTLPCAQKVAAESGIFGG
jgi:hypothetical protein